MTSEDLHAQIVALWDQASRPSPREISSRCHGSPSHTTVFECLRGDRLPSIRLLRAIVEELGGDWDDYRPLYPAAPVRTVVVNNSNTDAMGEILVELRAIRKLLEDLRA